LLISDAFDIFFFTRDISATGFYAVIIYTSRVFQMDFTSRKSSDKTILYTSQWWRPAAHALALQFIYMYICCTIKFIRFKFTSSKGSRLVFKLLGIDAPDQILSLIIYIDLYKYNIYNIKTIEYPFKLIIIIFLKSNIKSFSKNI